ncbi:NAD(P)H-dependent oxidoreductase subunit E [Cytophagaceae bacterium DM2B3-1]|uniref:NAD(P)H-dependent oxidoreductase subunit E n=1 Tax=Xanthocytophaga flava TaxID=3048013 RepID=A0AAE3UA96_9BACT|nr:NAD(P)H-dependent oxidoreductase subunit E [Xanthocytophaga flavus]MDJ1468245.1 NAD(P)H-dependent oxidoreductase subunit E [Xanthocytophaga flavus]MDJ1485311.1 NAD(P)H-dependent oxidoreductase subunit E [Xanthocytophaga flavus]MDJ1494612.1 NAD(P)H-dependent oxidoreductase subunit E [Xanthocytophaga flavus]
MTEVNTPEKVEFSPETLKKAQEIIARYPEGRQKSALLPVLHLAQNEWNWLSAPVMDYVAGLLSIQPIEVYEVATFYTMFQIEPVGKYVLEVCRTGPCCLRGAENIIDYLENKLGTKVGGTTTDGLFTLKTVECLAACGFAPVLQVRLKKEDGNYIYYENLTPEKIDNLIATEWV